MCEKQWCVNVMFTISQEFNHQKNRNQSCLLKCFPMRACNSHPTVFKLKFCSLILYKNSIHESSKSHNLLFDNYLYSSATKFFDSFSFYNFTVSKFHFTEILIDHITNCKFLIFYETLFYFLFFWIWGKSQNRFIFYTKQFAKQKEFKLYKTIIWVSSLVI